MLYDRVNYTADISYLTNVFIYEYDISKANINILYSKGVINKETYDFLYSAERMQRQVYVGKLCKDVNVSNILKAGIIEAKKMLFEANNIQDRDVLSIKNDAVFIINRRLPNTKFGMINFIEKNIYTSFYKIDHLEFYYYYSNFSKEEYIDIKGISDDKIKLHEDHFLQILKDLFFSIQSNGPEISLQMLKDIYNEYVSLSLPVENYRNFDIKSMYHMNIFVNNNTGYYSDIILESQKSMLDITTNLKILLEIQKIIISIYFTKYK